MTAVRSVPIAVIEGDYTRDHEIYLRLSDSDLLSLSIVLRDALAASGVRMCHEQIVEGAVEPNGSHLHELVQLFRRVDAARHGRKTWNAEWRKGKR